jgi:hypothetical protein
LIGFWGPIGIYVSHLALKTESRCAETPHFALTYTNSPTL